MSQHNTVCWDINFVVMQTLLTGMRLGSAAKQPWLVANSAAAVWMQQQRFAPLMELLLAAVTMLLAQPDPGAFAQQLTSLAIAAASAAEHAALLAVLASTPQQADTAALPSTGVLSLMTIVVSCIRCAATSLSMLAQWAFCSLGPLCSGSTGCLHMCFDLHSSAHVVHDSNNLYFSGC